jgi:hypothetical protein
MHAAGGIMIGTKSASSLGALLLTLSFAPGCIAFVERGTRGGRVSPLASSGVQKGDKRADVLNKLGDPDEVTTSPGADGGSIEYMTYRAVDGFYVLLFGKVDYSTVRVTLLNGVVDSVSAYQSGKDTLILTGYSAASIEPLR